MAKDARGMIVSLASGLEKLATGMEADATSFIGTIPPDAPDYDRGYATGYCEGRIKSYQDLRKMLRDNPPSRFGWPRISLGFSWRF